MASDRSDDGRFAAILHEQMRVRFADILPDVPAPVYSDGHLTLSKRAFRFSSPEGAQFHYALGEGLSALRPDRAAEDEFEVYLWGTVFGTVAWLNGYFALHASAVELGGRAIAFTADSGVGKSTLAAALAALDMPHVCDDTLALARDGERLLAIPDRKPLKLWDDALALTGIASQRAIAAMPGKHFARAPLLADGPLVLADLVLVEEGPEVALEPITGAALLAAVAQSLYRDRIANALIDPAVHAGWMFDIAANVRVWRLTRPRSGSDRERFAGVVRLISGALRAIGS